MLIVSIFDVSPITVQPGRVVRRPTLSISAPVEWFRWLTRPRRVLLLLGAVWVINVCDLGFTLLEAFYSAFEELNPVAARLLGGPPAALVAYKMGLTGVSSAILLIYRRHRVSELGCWFLLATHFYVAICWMFYYQQKLACLSDPAVNIDPVLGACLP